MFRFLHSADWQLGARFAQFGARGQQLRGVRLTTLKRALDLAVHHQVDAFLVAGDLFEDNQVEDALVAAVLDLFRAYPSVSIILLPGNHDPFTGPDSIWQRKSFLNAPAHVRVVTQAGAIDLGGNVFLLASPLQQKLSTLDPSLKFVDLAAALPSEAIKIGLTHGALAIEGKHQPNDFPIALNAASRAGLDYLGLGHWHNWLSDTDEGRILMPGTPEPDQFANEQSGHVALVEIEGAGRPLRIQRLPVATLTWKAFDFDFLSAESSRVTLEATLAALSKTASQTVVRVSLSGTVSPQAYAEIRTWLEARLGPFLFGQIVDRTQIALSATELQDLRGRHPILAQVLADIDRLEALATGQNITPAAAPVETGPAPLTLAEAQSLLTPSKIELARLAPDFFAQLRQVVLQSLQEIST